MRITNLFLYLLSTFLLSGAFSLSAQTTSSLFVSVKEYNFSFTPIGSTVIKGVWVNGKELDENIRCYIEGNKDQVFQYHYSQNWNAKGGGYLTIKFTPKDPVAYEASLILISGENQSSIKLNGIGHYGSFFGVKPKDVSFNMTPVGETNGQVLTIRNEYTSKGFQNPVRYRLAGEDAASFTLKERNWFPYKGGDLIIEFTPLQLRSYEAELILESDDTPSLTVRISGLGE